MLPRTILAMTIVAAVGVASFGGANVAIAWVWDDGIPNYGYYYPGAPYYQPGGPPYYHGYGPPYVGYRVPYSGYRMGGGYAMPYVYPGGGYGYLAY